MSRQRTPQQDHDGGSSPVDLRARLTAALADRYRIDREAGAGGMATAVVRETVSRTHRQIRVSLTGNGSDGRMIFIYQGPVNAVEAGAFNSIVRQIQSPGGWSTSRLTRSGWRFPQSSR